MKIYDIDGRCIEVTDLDAALMQADEFRGYETDEESHKPFVQRISAYWQDLHGKLTALKAKQDAKGHHLEP